MAEKVEKLGILTELKAGFKKWFIAAVVGGLISALTVAALGWWFYYKPEIIKIIGGVPSGGVVAFESKTCPEGWTSLESAAGRYIVGLQPGKAPGREVGMPLQAHENRSAGKHNHVVVDAGSHSHTHKAPIEYGAGSGTHQRAKADSSNTTGEAGLHNHTLEMPGAIEGTNAPYLELMVCRKN